MPTPHTLTDQNGRPITLGQKLGEGGEGAVYSVSHDTVAKLYLPGCATAEQFAKVQAMTRLANGSFAGVAAWPTQILYERGRPVGFIMPKLKSLKPIHQLFAPAERKKYFPKATWGFLIRASANLARAFATLHDQGIVLGDVNSNNVVIYPDATAYLVDCDSFQVRAGNDIFRCKVGMPEYQPPEFQGGIDYTKVTRTPAQDTFGLGVLIFQLIFLGRHPFAGVPPASFTGSLEPGSNIQAHRFFYGAAAAKLGFSPPAGGLALSAVPMQIGHMFETAFCGQPTDRPSARQWRDVLSEIEKHLIQCRANPAHQYAINGCPWCALEAMGAVYFIVPVVFSAQVKADPSIWNVIPNSEVERLWATVSAIAPPPAVSVFLQPPQRQLTPRPIPKALQEQAARHAIFAAVYAILTIASFYFVAGTVLGVGVLIGGWILLMVTRPDARSEATSRTAERNRHAAIVNATQEQWGRVASNLDFTNAKAKLGVLRNELLSQKAKADEHLRRLAFETFLDDHLLCDAKIPNVATKTKATLLSFGIETALDVDASKLARTGITINRQLAVLAWRDDVERRFRHIRNPEIPPHALREFYGRVSQERNRWFSELSSGSRTLQTTVNQTVAQRDFLRPKLESEQLRVNQAACDLAALKSFPFSFFCRMR